MGTFGLENLMSSKKIPSDIWRSACENIKEPLAIVDIDNKFIWVNKSFEIFTGYELVELLSMTWVDITAKDDVGNDMASVKSILNGQSNSYIMDKRYIHRKGHEIDVTIIVRRWPREPEAITMFYVEAIPPAVSKHDLENIVQELTCRMTRIESETPKILSSSNNPNEALKIRYFAIGFLAIIGMMMYLFYCLVMLQLKHEPEAPKFPKVQNTTKVDNTICLRQ